MTPTQTLNHLASIFFELINRDQEQITAVRLGYGNRLKVPDGFDGGNCQTDLSNGFISLWLTGSDVDCKSHGFCEVEEGGQTLNVSEVVYETRITVHAQRCDSFDRLNAINGILCHPDNGLAFNEDIRETPRFSTILDVSAISDGDEFEDRAETTMTVYHRHRTVTKLPCVTLCTEQIEKFNTETNEPEAVCH